MVVESSSLVDKWIGKCTFALSTTTISPFRWDVCDTDFLLFISHEFFTNTSSFIRYICPLKSPFSHPSNSLLSFFSPSNFTHVIGDSRRRMTTVKLTTFSQHWHSKTAPRDDDGDNQPLSSIEGGAKTIDSDVINDFELQSDHTFNANHVNLTSVGRIRISSIHTLSRISDHRDKDNGRDRGNEGTILIAAQTTMTRYHPKSK